MFSQSTPDINWAYPVDADIRSFPSQRVNPPRPIPDELSILFCHPNPKLEVLAEQFAIVAHVNIDWSGLKRRNRELQDIDRASLRSGSYWDFIPHRASEHVSLAAQFHQMISANYHQSDGDQED